MKNMTSVVLATFLATGAVAQESTITPAVQAESQLPGVVVPANTEIILRMSDELTSKGGKIKAGHMFRLTVA